MVAAFAFILTLCVPFVLSAGQLGVPAASLRRAVLWGCVLLSLIALALWLAGLPTLPLVVLAYAPAYQLELCVLLMNRFRRNYGRELQLILAGAVTDPDLRKDAVYSTLYFVSAVCGPMLVLVLFPSGGR